MGSSRRAADRASRRRVSSFSCSRRAVRAASHSSRLAICGRLMGIGCHLVAQSPTLAADERVQAKLAAGEDVLHLAFGEAGLLVLPVVAERLGEGAGRNGYGSVAGSAQARAAAAGYLERRGLPTDAGRIVFAPGSKPLLFALLQALPGDVVLPAPCWVSYAAHAALADKRVIRVPIGAEAGGVPDPAALRAALAEATGIGARPGVLVLTMPDNPTGTVASGALVREVCEVAEAANLLVVCDEIYRDLAHDPGAFVSPAEVLPKRTFVTTGLSKHMALGGWRVGLVRLADGPAGEEAGAAIGGGAGEGLAGPPGAEPHAAGHPPSQPPEGVERVGARRRPACSPTRRRSTGAWTPAGAGTARSPRPPTTWWWERARAAGRRAAPSTSPPTSRACRSAAAPRSPTTCSMSMESPCSRARRSATTPPRCASASPRACSTATATSGSSRRSAVTRRRRCRGSPQRSSGWLRGSPRSAPTRPRRRSRRGRGP